MTEHRTIGIVLGRFQPIHLGHAEYLEAAKAASSRLIIGITNPDLANLGATAEDPARSASANNPFTYFERLAMVEATCLDLGWSHGDFLIVPAPINDLSRLGQYLPSPENATFFVTIYDDWGEAKKAKLEHLGYTVVTLWRRDMIDRLTSGTAIRHSIRTGVGDWRQYVSPGAAKLLATYDGSL